MSASRRLRRPIGVVLLLIALAGAGMAGKAWMGGYRLFAVQTGSMTPALSPGDAVLTRPEPRVAPGQVITFRGGPDGFTTHRVVGIDPGGIDTKGDAHRTMDWGRRQPGDIVGTVVLKIPYGGYALFFLKRPTGIAALLLIVLGCYFVGTVGRERHHRRRERLSAARHAPPEATLVAAEDRR